MKSDDPLDRVRRKDDDLEDLDDDELIEYLVGEWIDRWEEDREEEAQVKRRLNDQMQSSPFDL